MKIRSLFLTLALLASSQVFAAENQPTLKADIISNSDKSKSSFDDTTKIQSADFSKIFSEADKYYKAALAWQKIKCEPKSGFVCTKHECPKREIKTFLILDKKKKTISRCDDVKHCEEFPADFKQNGVFFNVQTDGPVGTLVRILGDYRYKEISTVGLDAYIANGECQVLEKN